MASLIGPSALTLAFLFPAPVADAVEAELIPRHFSNDAVAKSILVSSTGEEDVEQIFQKAKCTECHSIPGIRQAHGKIGPRLIMGSVAPKRLSDPRYSGSAKTIREYVIESILDHDLYIPKGMRSSPMPMNYNVKLSAGALDKMTAYLANLEEGKLPPTPPDYCQSDGTQETNKHLKKTRKQLPSR